jgi:hypothetical protein
MSEVEDWPFVRGAKSMDSGPNPIFWIVRPSTANAITSNTTNATPVIFATQLAPFAATAKIASQRSCHCGEASPGRIGGQLVSKKSDIEEAHPPEDGDRPVCPQWTSGPVSPGVRPVRDSPARPGQSRIGRYGPVRLVDYLLIASLEAQKEEHMRLLPGKSLVALGVGLLAMVLAVGGGATAAEAAQPMVVVPPQVGILFTPTPNNQGQCGGPQQQWAPEATFSAPIRIDTDNRPGGCNLAFGVYDPSGVLAGIGLSYTWVATPGADQGQCGNQGAYSVPITQFQVFGPQILDDTDNRAGFCDLTFQMSGPVGYALDIQFYPDGDSGQCQFGLPQGQFRTVTPGLAVTIGLDTDNRPGGCDLALRLRQA